MRLVGAVGIEPATLDSSGSIRVKKNSVQLIGLQSNYSPKRTIFMLDSANLAR